MAKDDITFSKQAMVAVIAQLLVTGKASLDYKIISAHEGTRSASGWEHQFRPLMKDARDLAEQIKKGKNFAAVPGTPRKSMRLSFIVADWQLTLHTAHPTSSTGAAAAQKVTKGKKRSADAPEDDDTDELPTKPTPKKKAKKGDTPIKSDTEDDFFGAGNKGNGLSLFGGATDYEDLV